LVLAPIPSERGFLWDDQPISPDLPRESWPKTRAIVPLAISFRDNADHVTRNTPKRVVVRLEQISGAATLGSDSVLQVRDGRTFPDSVVVHGVGGFRLRLVAERLQSTATPTLYSSRVSRRLDELYHLGRLRVVAGSVNGVPVDSVHRVIPVRPGQPIDGTLQLNTITDVRAAANLLGAVPLWGDRVSNYLVLGALPAFGDYTEQVQLRDRLTGRQLRAPIKPGRYPLLLIWHPETEMRYIASGTNWMLGTPQWNDGNDLQDLGPAELADIESQGYFWWRLLKPTDEPGRPAAIFPTVLNATALYFEVQ
jgi:hypothetical protein